MIITVMGEETHQVFHFSGEIDFEDTPQIEEYVYQHLSTGFKDVVFDLKNVPT
jgi:anti-anti-sigma regulatory factor